MPSSKTAAFVHRAFLDAKAALIIAEQTEAADVAAAKRALARTAADAFKFYCAPNNWIGGNAKTSIPAEIALIAAEVFAYAATGRTSPVIALRGGNVETVDLLSCKRAAILYLRASEVGIIKNRNPVHTLCTAFNIDDSTLAVWRNDCTDESTDPSLFMPDNEPVGRGVTEDIDDNDEPIPPSQAERDSAEDIAEQDALRLSDSDNPNRIRALMLRAATHYQLIGRLS